MTTGLNLYIGNLTPTINDEALHQLFGQFGAIQSCKVMIDKATGQSKGFGFVKYEDENNALRAVSTMNGVEVAGNNLVVKVAEKDQTGAPTIRPSNNLFVRNLPPAFSEADLQNVFSQFGSVTSCIIMRDLKSGHSRGYGLVKLSTVAEAAAALKGIHGLTLEGAEKPIEVKYAEGEDERQARRTQNRAPLIAAALQRLPFGGSSLVNLPAAAALSGLGLDGLAGVASLLPAQVGLAAGGGSGRSAGMLGAGAGGLVGSSANAAAVAQAAAALGVPSLAALPPLIPAQSMLPLRTSELRVPSPRGLQPPEEDTNLYIYGLDPAIDELFLYKTFAPYGAIVSVKVIMDLRKNVSKGYGFVKFQKKADAFMAMQALNGVYIGDRSLQVSIHRPKSPEPSGTISSVVLGVGLLASSQPQPAASQPQWPHPNGHTHEALQQ